MIDTNHESTYNYIANLEHENMMALDSLWLTVGSLGITIPYTEPVSSNFVLKKEIFFYILHKLLSDGWLRLAKNGQFLTGSIDEQIARFKNALPISESDVDGGIGSWFFFDECPAGAVWIHKLEDGTEHLVWT